MRKRSTVVFALIACALLGFVLWRLFRHQSDIRPALVTPKMDVHREFSEDISAKTYRALHNTEPVDKASRPRLIALTFDDGPYPIFTPLLLDELQSLHVPATFFLIGRDAQQWPEITKRIESDGNEIADHTLTHPDLDKESTAQVQAEVLGGRDVLWSLVHDPAIRTYMRPPHGRYTEATLKAVQDIGYDVVLWTDDSGDWRTIPPQSISRHLLRYATAPDLVLMHSGKLATIQALPLVIQRFRKAGYTFVTVGELLHRVSAKQLNHPYREAV